MNFGMFIYNWKLKINKETNNKYKIKNNLLDGFK